MAWVSGKYKQMWDQHAQKSANVPNEVPDIRKFERMDMWLQRYSLPSSTKPQIQTLALNKTVPPEQKANTWVCPVTLMYMATLRHVHTHTQKKKTLKVVLHAYDPWIKGLEAEGSEIESHPWVQKQAWGLSRLHETLTHTHAHQKSTGQISTL